MPRSAIFTTQQQKQFYTKFYNNVYREIKRKNQDQSSGNFSSFLILIIQDQPKKRQKLDINQIIIEKLFLQFDEKTKIEIVKKFSKMINKTFRDVSVETEVVKLDKCINTDKPSVESTSQTSSFGMIYTVFKSFKYTMSKFTQTDDNYKLFLHTKNNGVYNNWYRELIASLQGKCNIPASNISIVIKTISKYLNIEFSHIGSDESFVNFLHEYSIKRDVETMLTIKNNTSKNIC